MGLEKKETGVQTPEQATSVQPQLGAENVPFSQDTFTQGSGDYQGNIYGNQLPGFDIFSSGFMTTNLGSELCGKVAKGITDFYAKHKKLDQFKVVEIDNAVISNLAYSAVVVAAINKTTVYFYTLMLAGTGRSALRAKDFFLQVQEANKPSNFYGRDKQAGPAVYLPYDAFDEKINAIIKTKLEEVYDANYAFVSLDGMVVNEDCPDTEEAYHDLAAKAFNAIHAEMNMGNGVGNATIQNIVDASAGLKVQTNGCRNTQSLVTKTGSPIRADFQLGLIPMPKKATDRSIHTGNMAGPLFSVVGYVDAVPTQTEVTEGNIKFPGIRLRPHVIVTGISTNYETPGMALLALATSVIMTKPEMWLASVSPRGNRNPGALNLLTNLSKKEGTGMGDFVNLNEKSFTPDVVTDVLTKMYSLSPILSIDIEEFGRDSYILGMLSAAAQDKNMTLRQNALGAIVKTLTTLTNGAFPANYNINEIIAGYIEVPMGSYMAPGSNQPSDIRDFDMERVLIEASSNDVLIRKLINSDKSPATSFMDKEEVVATIAPEAKITGKARRVMFHPRFVEALTATVLQNGLKPFVTPEVEIVKQYGYFLSGSAFDNAGVGNASFGNFYTPESNFNYNSFRGYGSNVGSHRF